MSVYTPIYKNDLDQLLKQYTIGTLIDFSGVEDGIENTTYFITTEKEKALNEWVLTIFEQMTHDVLPQFVHLLVYLAQSALPVPNPICNAMGQSINTLAGKPAVLLPKLSGYHIATPLSSHCDQIGASLGKLHTETISYPQPLPPARDLTWIEAEVAQWIDQVSEAEQKLLKSATQLCRYKLETFKTLPKAIIHGDLFIDNALFTKGQLTGLIDFYSAGQDYMLMDIAIALNDWCVNSAGALDELKVQALIDGYQSERPLTALEHTALPSFLLLAALRFWVYRLKVKILNSAGNRSGNLITVKDPNWFRDMVQMRQKALTG